MTYCIKPGKKIRAGTVILALTGKFFFVDTGGHSFEDGGCLCMTGCDDVRHNPSVPIGSGLNMCCKDWAEVALIHCPQGRI